MGTVSVFLELSEPLRDVNFDPRCKRRRRHGRISGWPRLAWPWTASLQLAGLVEAAPSSPIGTLAIG